MAMETTGTFALWRLIKDYRKGIRLIFEGAPDLDAIRSRQIGGTNADGSVTAPIDELAKIMFQPHIWLNEEHAADPAADCDKDAWFPRVDETTPITQIFSYPIEEMESPVHVVEVVRNRPFITYRLPRAGNAYRDLFELPQDLVPTRTMHILLRTDLGTGANLAFCHYHIADESTALGRDRIRNVMLGTALNPAEFIKALNDDVANVNEVSVDVRKLDPATLQATPITDKKLRFVMPDQRYLRFILQMNGLTTADGFSPAQSPEIARTLSGGTGTTLPGCTKAAGTYVDDANSVTVTLDTIWAAQWPP